MIKSGIDQSALIEQFSQATAKQGEALRKGVEEATLKALQGRELTLKHIKDVLNTVTKTATAGVLKNQAGAVDVGALLGKAVTGMDSAVVQAVEAHRRALQQLVDQGVALRETQVKKAMTDIEKMEDAMFASINKAVAGASQTLQGPWAQALGAFKQKGSATGVGAAEAVEQLTARAQAAAREGRALGQQAAQALLDHYATLASGVLIGMSSALQPGAAAKPSTATPAATKPTARKRTSAK